MYLKQLKLVTRAARPSLEIVNTHAQLDAGGHLLYDLGDTGYIKHPACEWRSNRCLSIRK